MTASPQAATLFDYNGVLVDDELVHLAAFRDVVGPLGIELSDEDYFETYLGFDDREAFRQLLLTHGRPAEPHDVQALIELKRPRYLERAGTALRFFEGAAELLARRASAGPVVIVSGALREEIELGLAAMGTQDAVAAIVSTEDTTASKPNPQGYLLGIAKLEALGIKKAAEVAWVFEDSLDGIQAAKAAGLRCVGVAHSYPLERLTQAGADHAVPTIAEVKTRLAELF